MICPLADGENGDLENIMYHSSIHGIRQDGAAEPTVTRFRGIDQLQWPKLCRWVPFPSLPFGRSIVFAFLTAMEELTNM